MLKLPSHTPEALFKGIFILAVFTLGFFAGAAALYYKWPAAESVRSAFKGGKALLRKEMAVDEKKYRRADIDRYIARFKTQWDEKLAYNGYTLITLRFEDVYLIDMHGEVVRQWNLPFDKAWPDPAHTSNREAVNVQIDRARLLPNGDLIVLYAGPGDTPVGYGLAKYDKDGKLLWTYDANAHHDFYIAQDGSIYVLVNRIVHTPLRGLEHVKYPQLEDFIVHLSPDGKELARISLHQAVLDSEYADMLRKKSKPAWPKSSWDRIHSNSVMKLDAPLAKAFPMFQEGQVLVSMRNMNALAVIDMTEKKAVWAVRGPWLGQHSAHFLPGGNILIFDNRGLENLKGGRVSRVLAFDPFTKKMGWQFSGTDKQKMDSAIYARVQPLKNGNTLIVESLGRRVWEVTPDKQVAWKYAYKGGSRWAIIMSALRYSPEELPFLKAPQ